MIVGRSSASCPRSCDDDIDRLAIGRGPDDDDASAGLPGESRSQLAHPLRRPPLRPSVRGARRDADERSPVPPVFGQQAIGGGAVLVADANLGDTRPGRDAELPRQVLVVLGLVQPRTRRFRHGTA